MLSSDPDTDGLLDKGEYFFGVGFVAIQQYLVDTLIFTGVKKVEAYNLGDMHASGITYISLINFAANWWKHESEWTDQEQVPKNGQRTFDNILNVTNKHEYALSIVLGSICGQEDLSFNSKDKKQWAIVRTHLLLVVDKEGAS